MSRMGLLFLIFAALVWTMRPALPQGIGASMPCDQRDALARELGRGYDEMPVSSGVQSDGRLLEVFSSPRTGSWTIISTAPDGLACVVAAGEGWQPTNAVEALDL